MPANRDLVVRDPALPALALLLDPARLRDWLEEQLPGQTIGELSRTYLRYKPGDSCLAGYSARIDGITVPLSFLARRHEAADKFAKVEAVAERAAVSDGAAFVDDRLALAFYRFPGDPGLKYLAHLTSPSLRARLLRRLGLPRGASISTVNFRPGRRFVARVEHEGQPIAVLKMHAPGAFTRVLDRTRGFAPGDVIAPAVIAAAPRRHVIASEWIDGHPVARETCAARAIGEAIARFHRHPIEGLHAHDAEGLRRMAHAMAADMARLAPSLGERAKTVAARVASSLPDTEALVSLHGDFHLKQIVETPRGVGLIDLDEAVRGPAAFDLATLLAHEALRMPDFMVPDDLAADLLEGYRAGGGMVDNGALAAHSALALLRLGLRPFREQWDEWPNDIARLLDRVESLCPANAARLLPTASEARIDPAMPQIERALDPAEVTRRLAAAGVSLTVEQAELVRHKCARRCLIRYHMRTEEGVVIEAFGKVRAKGADSRTFALHQALREGGLKEGNADSVFVARPIALVPELSMWVQESAGGQAFTPDHCPPEKAAGAIEALHRSSVTPLRRHLLADELAILSTRFEGFIQRRPELAAQLTRLLDMALAIGERVGPVQLRPIHRDFYQDHLLLTDAGTCLLDLDLVTLGDPAVDFGNFLAHLSELALRSSGDPFHFAGWQERFRFAARRSGLTTSGNIAAYEFLSLVRLVEIADRMPERRQFVGELMGLCDRHAETIRTQSRRPA